MENGDHFCKIDAGGFAKSAAGTMGLVYIVCTVFVALWPNFALQLLGWLIHVVNVDKFAGGVAITFGGFIAGLAQVIVYSYIVAWLIARLHNKFCKAN